MFTTSNLMFRGVSLRDCLCACFQRALLAPFRQRFSAGGVPLNTYPLVPVSIDQYMPALIDPALLSPGGGPERGSAVGAPVLPMVSALCVSKLSSLALLRRAVACFHSQDWPPGERGARTAMTLINQAPACLSRGRIDPIDPIPQHGEHTLCALTWHTQCRF